MSKTSRNDFPRAIAPRSARWLLAALGALLAGAAAAALPLQTIEECIETGTAAVSLPGVAGGSVSASACSDCAATRLLFGATTRYYIGRQAVTYAKFRAAAAKADQRLDVFYEPKTRTLTRLRIPAAAGAK